MMGCEQRASFRGYLEADRSYIVSDVLLVVTAAAASTSGREASLEVRGSRFVSRSTSWRHDTAVTSVHFSVQI